MAYVNYTQTGTAAQQFAGAEKTLVEFEAMLKADLKDIEDPNASFADKAAAYAFIKAFSDGSQYQGITGPGVDALRKTILGSVETLLKGQSLTIPMDMNGHTIPLYYNGKPASMLDAIQHINDDPKADGYKPFTFSWHQSDTINDKQAPIQVPWSKDPLENLTKAYREGRQASGSGSGDVNGIHVHVDFSHGEKGTDCSSHNGYDISGSASLSDLSKIGAITPKETDPNAQENKDAIQKALNGL